MEIIDLIDAYHYADCFDEERYAWVGWQDYSKYTVYDVITALADRLFWALNPTAKTQADWTEWEAGYDVRVYDDKNMIPTQCHLWQTENFSSQDLSLENFELLETFADDSHFWRYLLKCKECGQLYFYEFYE